MRGVLARKRRSRLRSGGAVGLGQLLPPQILQEKESAMILQFPIIAFHCVPGVSETRHITAPAALLPIQYPTTANSNRRKNAWLF